MSLLKRLWALKKREQTDREIEEELRSHLEMRTADNMAVGMTRDRALRDARLRFGNPVAAKERVHAVDAALGLESVFADIRYAFRGCLKNPGFTAAAVLILAIGIGLNVTFFTAFDGVALRLLPVKDPQKLFRIEQWLASGTTGNTQFFFSWPEYLYYRDHNRGLSDLIAVSRLISVPAVLPGANAVGEQTFQGQVVSPNFFSSLADRAAAGRFFLAAENELSSEPVMVLSYPFWQRQFHGDLTIVGKALKINDATFIVVGVAPRDFIGTAAPPVIPDFWAPVSTQSQLEPGHLWTNQPDDAQLQLLARPQSGIGRSQGEAEFLLLAQEWGQTRKHLDRTIAITFDRATFFDETNAPWFRNVVGLLMAMIGLVLLIASTNLANMLLARGNVRRHEIAVRRALGASRGRLLRQLLTESILLSLMGGAGGLAVSLGMSHLLGIALTQIFQTLLVLGSDAVSVPLTVDVRILAYTLLVSVIAGIAFGLYPALQFSKADSVSALKDENATSGQQVSRSRLRSLLVGSQFAVSLFLLICAGLLTRGFQRSLRVDPGFETRHVLMVALNTGLHPSLDLQRRVIDRLKSIPQVTSVAISYKPPGTGTYARPAMIEGVRGSQTILPRGELLDDVSPEYFQTMSVPILWGRNFTRQEAESGAAVAVVSQETAKRFWPGEDAIGKRFKLDLNLNHTWREFEVIAVAKDVRNANLTRIDPAFFYLPTAPDRFNGNALLIRVQGDPRDAERAVLDSLNAMDRSLRPSLLSMDDGPMRIQRLLPEMLGLFVGILACLALPLAAVGIYGVMAYLVSQRTREIGIRMALGATRTDVLRLILREGMQPVLIGATLGFLLSAVASSGVHALLVFPGSPDMLFGVSFLDPASFLGLSCFLGGIALLASYIPARRAMKVDPMAALHYE
jgi:macrolide transport system ATP-binding/permease protein